MLYNTLLHGPTEKYLNCPKNTGTAMLRKQNGLQWTLLFWCQKLLLRVAHSLLLLPVICFSVASFTELNIATLKTKHLMSGYVLNASPCLCIKLNNPFFAAISEFNLIFKLLRIWENP